MKPICFAGAILLALLFTNCKKEHLFTANQDLKISTGNRSNFIAGQALTNGVYVFMYGKTQCFQSTNSIGAPVQINKYIGYPNQQWDVYLQANGYYLVLNHQSGLALEVPGFSTTPDAALDTWTPNGGDNQLWQIDYQGYGIYTLQNKNSHMVVTLKNNDTTQFQPIVQSTYSGSNSQTWMPGQIDLLRIRTSGTKFVYPNGTEFKAWGKNYVGNKLQSLMEDKWDQAPVMSQINTDLAYIKSLGANVVRLQLQYWKYMTSTTAANQANINRLLQVVNFAKQNDLYVIITGLAAFRQSDQPSYYVNLSDADRWTAQANFWKSIAGSLKNNNTILSYDLMNEPFVAPANRTTWSGTAPTDTSSSSFTQFITRTGYADQSMLRPWINQLTNAIRTQDAITPITVGFVNINGNPFATFTTSLSYGSLHLYPVSGQSADAVNSINNFKAGDNSKPVLIEEIFPFGVYHMTPDELAQFCVNNKTLVSGWVSQYFGYTIADYQARPGYNPSITTDDGNTVKWFQDFQYIAPTMKTP